MNHQFIPVQEISLQIDQLHIASLIAHVRPEKISCVREWINQQPQNPILIEIHAETEQGKFVIVTESAEDKAIVNFLDELRAQVGVLNAALVYHEYLSHQDLLDDKTHEGKI